MAKKVALVCYSFPPFPGVGGRRWAKFAKYLAADGYEVYAIGAKNIYPEQSEWTKDVQHKNIQYIPLPVAFPKLFFIPPKNKVSKIFYRVLLLVLSIISKGNVYERMTFWRSSLNKTLKRLIEQDGVNNVIVTMPPFYGAYFVALLKQQYPTLNYILDYRDPWTIDNIFHGFSGLSKKRLQKERYYEAQSVKAADHILSVSHEMTQSIEKQFKGVSVKTLTNGYDPADIPAPVAGINGNSKLNFVYAGTLYSNLNPIIGQLVDYFRDVESTDKTLYDKLSFHFYGKHNKEIEDNINNAALDALNVHTSVPLSEMTRQIQASAACILIPPPHYTVVFNTKFYEYLVNRRFIIIFSYPCFSTEFIKKNRLGYIVDPSNFKHDLDILFKNWDSILSDFNKDFDINSFSVPYLTKELEKLLK